MTAAGAGPVVFAYDGSDLAEAAIAEAGLQLRAGRDALVLTIWEPFNVGFLPVGDVEFNAAQVDQVRKAAEQTAAHGAALAGAAGFQAESMAAEAAPTWRGIVDAADQHDASLIVLGSHGRSGLAGAVRRQRRQRGRGAFPAVSADRACREMGFASMILGGDQSTGRSAHPPRGQLPELPLRRDRPQRPTAGAPVVHKNSLVMHLVIHR